MSGLRIARPRGLDAALARLSAWWDGLSMRERVLVGTMAALLAAVVLVYGVVKPLQGARADALADVRTYETLNARLRAAGPNLKAAAPQRTGPPAEAVTQAATALGFQVQASAAPAGAGVAARATAVPYDAALAWIADVERTTALRPARVLLTRAAAGRVNAEVSFQ